eukprot:scaffold2609_cov24-Tisochrysis_lutea.AAC.1
MVSRGAGGWTTWAVYIAASDGHSRGQTGVRDSVPVAFHPTGRHRLQPRLDGASVWRCEARGLNRFFPCLLGRGGREARWREGGEADG